MYQEGIYISTAKYTVFLVVCDRRISEAPPIARWTIGKNRNQVLRYYSKQAGCRLEFFDNP